MATRAIKDHRASGKKPPLRSSKSGRSKRQSDDDSRQSAKKIKTPTDRAASHGPRPLWTGVIAFGLVSMPVSLYSATRHWGSSLKMVDASGQPLSRRYRCEKHDVELSASDIIRGYEIDEGQFVTLEDDELRALAPEKSSEINLQKFISLDDIHPIYFDKSYFLVPDTAAVRAYRLLAESMEKERRAGIATFVMRDKEYLVAIISEAGILSAETLRFHDVIRTPGEIGLPPAVEAPKSIVRKLEHLIKNKSTEALDRSELEDQQTQRLKDLATAKLKKGIDIIKQKPRTKRQTEISRGDYGNDMEAVDKVIDLMKVLKSRIEKDPEGKSPQARRSLRPRLQQRLSALTRDELYEQARSKNIEGRSKMTKQQLIDTLSG